MPVKPSISLVILYVDNLPVSASFYTSLLGLEPTQRSSTFVVFLLPSGVGLGLWSRHTVEPAAAAAGTELAFIADDVDAMHMDWSERGLTIV